MLHEEKSENAFTNFRPRLKLKKLNLKEKHKDKWIKGDKDWLFTMCTHVNMVKGEESGPAEIVIHVFP